MVIDISAFLYMILAFYIVSAMLITGLATLGIWGFLKIKRRAPRENLRSNPEKKQLNNRSDTTLAQPHAQAL